MFNIIKFLNLEDYKIMNLRGFFYYEFVFFLVSVYMIFILWNMKLKIVLLNFFFLRLIAFCFKFQLYGIVFVEDDIYFRFWFQL